MLKFLCYVDVIIMVYLIMVGFLSDLVIFLIMLEVECVFLGRRIVFFLKNRSGEYIGLIFLIGGNKLMISIRFFN